MAQYSNLKAYIEEKIYENGTQAITGDILQDVLKVMTDDLGEFYQMGGVASPSTDPGTPDAKVIFIATEAGTYTNFGGITLAAGEVALLIFETSWTKETLNVLSAANGGVKTANLADGAVTTEKIAGGAVETAKIANNAVTSGKVADGAIGTAKIADGAIAADKIAANAVESAKIKNGAVTEGKINDGAVTAGKVAANAVTTAKIADEAVTTAKLNDGAVTEDKIATDAVTSGKVKDGAIGTAKIAAGAVTHAKIGAGAVEESNIKDGAVTSDKIANGAVGSDQLAEGAFSAENLADGSVTTDKLADGAVTAEKIADGAVTADKFANGSVTTIKLGSGAVTTEKIGDGMVTRQKLADSSVSTSKIIDGAVTTDKVADGAITDAKLENPVSVSQNTQTGGLNLNIGEESTNIADQNEILDIHSAIGASAKTLTDKDTTPSYIPTSDGSTTSGGNDYRAKDYDIENLSKTINIESQNLLIPTSGALLSGVLFALYSDIPSAENLLLAGPLLTTGQQSAQLNLSQYPTAKLLRITVDKNNPDYQVSYLDTSLAPKSQVDVLSNAVEQLQTNAVMKSDIIDNLESDASNKPLSAKQGKVLNDKFVYNQTLTDKGTTPSYIPTTEGTQSGGTYFRARDYDVEGLKGILTITSLYSFPSSGYVNAVLFALYTDTPSAETLIDDAYGSLLSSLQTTGSIDLSQYPTAKVLRITVDKDNPNYSVILKGDKYVNQEQFNSLEERVETIEQWNINNNEKGVSVELPNEIILPVGGRVELFVRSIVKAYNPYNYQVEVVCSVGKAYPRYFLFEATATHLNQTYSLQYNVYRNDGTLIATATTSIKVVAAATSPATEKNILVFGASIIVQGYVVAELKRRLTAKSGDADYGDGTPLNPYGKGLENISFVGRKQGTQVTGIPQEATGGWSWADYAGTGVPAYRFAVSGVTSLNIGDVYSNNGMTFTITEINITSGSGEIRCTYSGSGSPSASGTLTRVSGEGDASITYSSATSESYNPFYNNGSLDFSNYASLYCNSHIDYLIAFCGNNDYGRNITDIIDNIKAVADAYHYAFPTGKFVICTLALPDCTGGMGANYGASASMNYFDYAKYVFDFSKAVNELAQDSNYSSFVVVAPTLQEFDCEYSYPYGNVSPNNRSSETVHLGQNGIHPTGDGQKMFSDTLFFTMNNIL